ncbi:hypothetical protein [Streptomyces profundus]|uniref:hypothetical protein n=1 Tax=Streptomyces profundus TaxID=2867410 RepID=UPI001D16D24B|nr:hypothetical protein [Streptomyces sp. MA3_2.13]UED88542.1 hypothetical protein K4G22_17985 [Streptomyces sp. MA3_2.13]
MDAATWSPIHSREWYAARDAVAGLRDVLIAAGLDSEFPYLRADLNAFGMGLIELGRISPHTAERLAELIRTGLNCAQEHENSSGPGGRTP